MTAGGRVTLTGCSNAPQENQPAGTGADGVGRYVARRGIFAVLVLATTIILIALLTVAVSGRGIDVIELALIALFALTLPWLVIGFWNALIGGWLLWRDRIEAVMPLAPAPPDMPLTSRTAIVLPIREENPDLAFAHLRIAVRDLDKCCPDSAFEVFILSDTQSEDVAARERLLFREWQAAGRGSARLHYRRRGMNTDYKAGNLRDFCQRWGDAYEFMIVLDADSIMSGPAMLRLVRLMQANPQAGILQTLVVGLPTQSAFARLFQFGMRHGMRSYTVGSAWWQGDAGPYWGHNAIIRLAPFIAHCRLPPVPGRPPLGGPVLSHDQVEAVLMRKAGFAVRVLPIEDGSYEVNPPTLPDFIERDLRWCHGNLQYLRLLRLPGLRPLGRLQLLLAILMYTGSPCWLAFVAIGTISLFLADIPLIVAPPVGAIAGMAPQACGAIVFAAAVGISLAPKLIALLYALSSRRQRQSFGGGMRLIAGGLVELVFSMLLGPVMSVAHSLFMLRLAAGRPARWQAQVRAGRRVSWREAASCFWPQTVLGAVWLAALRAADPSLIVWASPALLALLLAIPFAVVTAAPAAALARVGLCATPEELAPSHNVLAACPWLDPAQRDPRASLRLDVS